MVLDNAGGATGVGPTGLHHPVAMPYGGISCERIERMARCQGGDTVSWCERPLVCCSDTTGAACRIDPRKAWQSFEESVELTKNVAVGP